MHNFAAFRMQVRSGLGAEGSVFPEPGARSPEPRIRSLRFWVSISAYVVGGLIVAMAVSASAWAQCGGQYEPPCPTCPGPCCNVNCGDVAALQAEQAVLMARQQAIEARLRVLAPIVIPAINRAIAEINECRRLINQANAACG